MKVSLNIPVRPGVVLEVHEASPEELRDLISRLQEGAPRTALLVQEEATREELIAIGVALGCSESVLRDRQGASISLAAGIRQVAESLRRSECFHRNVYLRMLPVIDAVLDCTCLCDCASLNALRKAVDVYKEASKADDSSTSPSAEGSTTSPSNAGDSNASPSVRTVCSGCGADVVGGVGAVLPDNHRCAWRQGPIWQYADGLRDKIL